MLIINSSDVVKKPSFITNPHEITFVEDAKKKVLKSVVIPAKIYENIKEQIEYQIWLQQNKGLLKESENPLDDVIAEVVDEVI